MFCNPYSSNFSLNKISCLTYLISFLLEIGVAFNIAFFYLNCGVGII